MSARANTSQVAAPPARFRLRVRFSKGGRLAYLGHLELIHTIERCIRRAALPYAVSQGFSPHMRIGYTSALPVGTSSSCEFYDVFLTDLVPAPEALGRLRAATPGDIAPRAAAYIDLREPALTAQISRIDYEVRIAWRDGLAPEPGALDRALAAVRALDEIPYLRGRKRKVLDVGRTLASLSCPSATGEGAVLELVTRCDNEGSLRPEIALAALDRLLAGADPADGSITSTGMPALSRIADWRVERTGQYIEDGDGPMRSPLPLGPEGEAARAVARALGNL